MMDENELRRLRQDVLENFSISLGVPMELLDTTGAKFRRLEDEVALLRHVVAMRESAKYAGILYIPEGIDMPTLIPFGHDDPVMPIIVRVPKPSILDLAKEIEDSFEKPIEFKPGGPVRPLYSTMLEPESEITQPKRTGWERFKDALLRGW